MKCIEVKIEKKKSELIEALQEQKMNLFHLKIRDAALHKHYESNRRKNSRLQKFKIK